MSVETLFSAVEDGLTGLIRLGLGWRHPQVPDVAALVALPVLELPPMALVFVQADNNLWAWDPDSQATMSATALQSTTLAPTAYGRWLRVDTAWTYGAGGVNLGKKPTGYLRSVETYACDDGPEAAIERVTSYLPGVLVQFVGDELESLDIRPGTFYRSTLSFKLLVLSQNLRYAPAATQGPRDAAEAADDPGVYRIVGDLRRLLHGNAFSSGIADVERIEVTGSELAFEAEDRRLYVWVVDVQVRASYTIEDEDIGEFSIRAQPELTECWPEQTFDRNNYVAIGGGLSEGGGLGLERTIDATVAVVNGKSVAVAARSVTFSASHWTYRDLTTGGAWVLTLGELYKPAPPQIPGALRVARTMTDSTGVVRDQALCSFSVPYGDPLDVA